MDSIRVLFISDEAWQRLHTLSEEAGYANRSTKRQHGFSDFVADILHRKLIDSRPDDIRSQDAEMLAANMSPEWILHSPRLRRSVRANIRTLIRASVQAYDLGIAASPSNSANLPSLLDSTACLSRILEAVGTGWLTYV
jgi:IS5 family transposase